MTRRQKVMCEVILFWIPYFWKSLEILAAWVLQYASLSSAFVDFPRIAANDARTHPRKDPPTFPLIFL